MAESALRQWADQEEIPAEIQSRALATVLEVDYVAELAASTPSPQFVERIPIRFARKHGLVGLANDPGRADGIRVAIAGLGSWAQLDVVARYLRCVIEPVLAPREQILSAINAAYEKRAGQAQAVIDSLNERESAPTRRLISREDLLNEMKHAPVVELVNKILFEAVKVHASDVHFQPYEDRLVVRMRIDGVLFDAFDLPIDVQDEAISRIKVIGKMNIAEKRLPQDGRSTVQVGDRSIDLRIASLPTSFGERIVVRLLDKSARVYTLDELGMDRDTLDRFRGLIKLEHGLILVTGPTGSGKSTTLYAALREINSKDRNVVTLEDPIEYQLEGISQTQVSSKKGMTFASGLRSVLRQDPDIIMVGEIRDEETAVMAIQSALTGHLVFSTLHTNDAASAVTRLLDLGIEPYLVSSSLISVMAQRLVRKVCSNCSREVVPSSDVMEQLGIESAGTGPRTIRQGMGCETCRHTGYRGRIGIFELLVVDDAVRHQIQGQSNASTIRDVAVGNGMRLLREDGLVKRLAGMTTIDEVARVTMRSAL
jgi:general secretion pathway protein E